MLINRHFSNHTVFFSPTGGVRDEKYRLVGDDYRYDVTVLVPTYSIKNQLECALACISESVCNSFHISVTAEGTTCQLTWYYHICRVHIETTRTAEDGTDFYSSE